MKIKGTHYRSLWWNHDDAVLEIIDQRWLPHDFRVEQVRTMQDFADAIFEMRVRGAPLIGATAA
jgi:methylthioribose-1-phosphate isomerase